MSKAADRQLNCWLAVNSKYEQTHVLEEVDGSSHAPEELAQKITTIKAKAAPAVRNTSL